MNPKYPDIEVNLVGEDGNAFAILARVIRAMKRADVSVEERNEFVEEATSSASKPATGSSRYDHLLQTCMKWVTVT